jgi:hypothetical protein
MTDRTAVFQEDRYADPYPIGLSIIGGRGQGARSFTGPSLPCRRLHTGNRVWTRDRCDLPARLGLVSSAIPG